MTWSEKDIARVESLWKEGHSAAEIGRKLGVTRNAIIGIYHRHRDLFPVRMTRRMAVKPSGGDVFWTETRLAVASRLWGQGSSASEIGRHMGCTAKAVYGACERHPERFPKRAKRVTDIVTLKKPAFRPLSDDGQPLPGMPDAWSGQDGEKFDLARFRLEGREPVSFAALSARQCHFPLQDFRAVCGPETPHCGAPVLEGRSYCAAHWRLMHRKAVAA